MPTGNQLANDCRQLAREHRERRINQVRGAIHVRHYATKRRLDAALDKLIDVEGFTSHAPVMRADDAAMDELMDLEFQRQTESDR